MKNSRSYFVTGMGILFLLVQISCSTRSKIAHYSGDGEIKAMPGGVVLGGGGCIVKFKPIKLDQPAHFTYQLKGLPAWEFGLFFTIEDPRIWTDRRQYEFYQQPSQLAWAETNHFKFATYDDLKGTLAMSLKDAKGDVVIQFKRKLSELIWSRAGVGPWDLYDLRNVHFMPSSNMQYTLEINIDPDLTLKDNMGYVLLRGGGHEGISIGFQ
jgi:hypothetical protein